MVQYIDSNLFDTIPTIIYKKSFMRHVKNTALMKYINETKGNSYIIVVLTNSIANYFYYVFDYKENLVKLCINDGSFKDIKLAFDNNGQVIITIYHISYRCFDSIIEFIHEYN